MWVLTELSVCVLPSFILQTFNLFRELPTIMRAQRALNTTRSKEAGKWPLRSTLALKNTRFVSISCNQIWIPLIRESTLILVKSSCCWTCCCPADEVSHQETLLEEMGQHLILSFQIEDKEKEKEKPHLLIPETGPVPRSMPLHMPQWSTDLLLLSPSLMESKKPPSAATSYTKVTHAQDLLHSSQ